MREKERLSSNINGEFEESVRQNEIITSSLLTDIEQNTKMFESDSVLYQILDYTDSIILVIDRKKNVRYINKKGCEILGCSQKEIVGKNWIDNFIPSEIKNKIDEYMLNTFNEDKTSEEYFENFVLSKNNEKLLIGWKNFQIKDKEDSVVFVGSIGQDLTDHKHKETIDQVVLKILKAADSPIDISDFYKFIHQSIGELMPVNNFYVALYDKSEELIHLPYYIDEADPEAESFKPGKGLTEYVMRTGKSILLDKKADEELVRIGEVELIGIPASIWLGVPLKIQDKVIGALVVQDYHDENIYSEKDRKILEVISYAISRVIERKLMESEKNVLIEKLKSLNASKDRLFSLISHDLRSPFNSLLGFSEILATEYETLTKEEIQEYLHVIYDSSKNLFNMTNNLLHFSRFQMGRLDYKPERLQLQNVINKCMNMLKGNLMKKNIALSIMLDKSTDIFADEDMMVSIFQNILSNAIKFTPQEGNIRLKAARINAHAGLSRTQITITDSGVGMNEETLEKVFKDTMESTPGTDREFGTGLGLLLVKEFVERNGGTISVKSRENEGTTFTLLLPSAN